MIYIFKFLLLYGILFSQNFDPITGKPLNKYDPVTGEKLEAFNLPKINLANNQDCYQDGIEAAKIDFSDKGYIQGGCCGIFGLLGWGVGTLVYSLQEPKTPYMYMKDLDSDCRYNFDEGYKGHGKKIRNKNFHTVAGILTAVGLILNLSS